MGMTYIVLALFWRRVAVRIRHLGGLAEASYNGAMDSSQQRHGAEADGQRQPVM